MAESIGQDGSKFRKSVYLDVITLCDDALKTWSEQLDRIEAQVAEAIGRSAL